MLLFRSFRGRIALSFTLLTASILAGFSLFFLSQLHSANLNRLRTQLTAQSVLLSGDYSLRAGLEASRRPMGDDTLARLAHEWGARAGARITVIGPDGVALADSRVDPGTLESQAGLPEVREAFASGVGFSRRSGRSFGEEALFAAAAVAPLPGEAESGGSAAGEELVGIVRLSLPLQEVSASLNPLRRRLLAALLAAIGACGLFAYLAAGRTARPLRRLIQSAARMAQEDLGARMETGAPDEVGQLARLFDRLRDRMEAQVNSVTRARGRLTSLLDSLVDGVFILDAEGRVRLCNVAAARMVGAEREPDPRTPVLRDGEDGSRAGTAPSSRAASSSHAAGHFRGQPLAQVVRDHRIVDTWQSCQDDGEQAESVIQWGGKTVRVFALPIIAGGGDGCIVLLQDMTTQHRLERMRRDFVSNISHELRTPLASLRALTETLRDGALDDPGASRRFLDRIETEVDSLALMVQELLELSRIESGQVPFRFRPCPVSEIVLTPVERMQSLAARKRIDLVVDLPARLPNVLADAERVQQVVTNLVHNALKFSPEGGSITVSANTAASAQTVTVSVADRGIGIPIEDQDRIFERFYKTDRARSGGGTGLGLAIAKHIVQAHGGSIWVESVLDRGSAFSFTLTVAAGAH